MITATKAAQKLAADNGLAIDQITGTGKEGSVTVDDVKRTLEAGSNALLVKPEFDQTDAKTWIDPAHGLTIDSYRLAGEMARKGDAAQSAGQDAVEDVLMKAARVFMEGVSRCDAHWNQEKNGIPDVVREAWQKGLKANMHTAYNGRQQTSTLKAYETRVTWCLKRGITPNVTKLSIPCVRYLPPNSEGKVNKVIEYADLTVSKVNQIKAGYWVEGNASKGGLWAPGFAAFVGDPAKVKANIEAKCKDGAKDTSANASDDGPDETSELLTGLTSDECSVYRQISELIRTLDKAGQREFADEILNDALAALMAQAQKLAEAS